MKASSHKLPKDIQNLMLPQSRQNPWPSPSPGSLFQATAASKWLQEYWKHKDHSLQGVQCNSAWMSVLALPGSFVAQQSTGTFLKVIASSQFSFLGWEITVQTVGSAVLHFAARKEKAAVDARRRPS